MASRSPRPTSGPSCSGCTGSHAAAEMWALDADTHGEGLRPRPCHRGPPWPGAGKRSLTWESDSAPENVLRTGKAPWGAVLLPFLQTLFGEEPGHPHAPSRGPLLLSPHQHCPLPQSMGPAHPSSVARASLRSQPPPRGHLARGRPAAATGGSGLCGSGAPSVQPHPRPQVRAGIRVVGDQPS